MILEGLIIAIGLILDRITKWWAVNFLKDSQPIQVIKNIFAFDYLENQGAGFGILQGKTFFLVILTMVVTIGLIIFLVKNKPKSKALRISLAMIISGAIGNMIDRIAYKYVIDFILLHYKDVYYFPTFNVADIFVTVGTVFLLICIIKDEI